MEIETSIVSTGVPRLGPDMAAKSFRPWPWDDDETLRREYGYTPIPELAQKLGRTLNSVKARAMRIGVARKEGEDRSLRPLLTPKPPDRSYAIGTERLYRGHLWRKVSKTGVVCEDWKRVCVIEWEAANGLVPPGHTLLIVRKRSELQLVSIAEIPFLNASMNAPEELRELYKLKSRLGKALLRMEKAAGGPASKSGRAWSDTDLAYLRTSMGVRSHAEMAAHLKRSPKAVEKRISVLGAACTS